MSEEPISLSLEELAILAFTGDVDPCEESPLSRVLSGLGDELLDLGAKRLVARGLADRVTLRPKRELQRRLLVVSQPDARVLLLERDGTGTRRTVEFFERAGAYVPYSSANGEHRFGEPVDWDEVLRTVLAHLPTRASRGDFVDFTVNADEYFALSVFAGEATRRARRESVAPHHVRGRVEVADADPPTLRQPIPSLIGDDEGTPIARLFDELPRRPAGPSWDDTLRSLVKKDVLAAEGGSFRLRPYLRDLALALGTKHRTVLTRLDFGAEDWIVRDATMIPVPGSLFVVRALDARIIRIAELDAQDLEATARCAIEPSYDRD